MAELVDSLLDGPVYAFLNALAPVLRTYSIASVSQPEVGSHIISGEYVRLIVQDKGVKFRDPHLNCSP